MEKNLKRTNRRPPLFLQLLRVLNVYPKTKTKSDEQKQVLLQKQKKRAERVRLPSWDSELLTSISTRPRGKFSCSKVHISTGEKN